MPRGTADGRRTIYGSFACPALFFGDKTVGQRRIGGAATIPIIARYAKMMCFARSSTRPVRYTP
jgi:hypothetical protein